MSRQIVRALAVASLLTLSGCASMTSQPSQQMANLILAEPEQPTFRHEIELAKISDMLTKPLNDDERAVLFYRRGALYDAMGLRTLARIDFNRALEFQPRLADAYNYLGIHYTQMGEFQYAYEAFDAVIELEPDHDYAYLNRGIAGYYDNRDDIAEDDIGRHYQAQTDDPYRVLWLYFGETLSSPERALTELRKHRQAIAADDWALNIIDLYLGDLSERQFLKRMAQQLAEDETLSERLCEAYFYLGKFKQLQGQHAQAMNYFKLALATNVYEFVEHRYAALELSRSREQVNAQQAQP
ncbi:lipoprotein NlpI [Idiomarina xiamenensis]|uniref:Lipoprotein NlpI n=1 Tax=Idiomarina xiamenensis 10-D-4 TaxID=740709 RepID=K2JZ79_9GAMM|nr:lipoprotein NlpI [Idiomarina xiamenensis]EKE79922.1 lipoprotein NlpI [Idiomarina xiamenensis 10-D-4]